MINKFSESTYDNFSGGNKMNLCRRIIIARNLTSSCEFILYCNVEYVTLFDNLSEMEGSKFVSEYLTIKISRLYGKSQLLTSNKYEYVDGTS